MCSARVIVKSLLWLLLAVGGCVEALKFTQSYQPYLNVLTSMMDDFLDPCEDFFEHACGNFDAEMEPFSPFLYNKESAVRFFENNRGNFSTHGGILLNGLYESCKNRKLDEAQWKQIGFLADYAQWPFLHYQWEEQNIDTTWQQLAAQLAARGVPVLFEVFFAKNTIYVSPVDITCPATREEVKASILRFTSTVLGEQAADVLSAELWSFCKEISGQWISEDTPDESSILDETNEFFNEFFLILQFTADEIEKSRKIQIKIDRLEQMLMVLRKKEPRVVANFLIWKMIQALDYDDCFKLTKEYEPLLLSEYWNWDVFGPRIRRDVFFANFHHHTTRFQKRRREHLASADWTSILNKKPRKMDFNIERMIRNYANTKLSTQDIAADYSGIVLHRRTFFKNYFSMKARQLRLSFVNDNFVDDEDTNHAAYFLRKFLNFAILSERLPLFHYFSTEGFDLWYKSGLFKSIDELYAAIDCLNRQTELYADEYKIFSSLSAEQMEEVLKFYRAFYESYYDYMFWLEGETFSFAEDHVLEHFKLNATRVMFYSVAQLYCGRDDARYSALINRSFMNSLEFQDAFECDIEVPMNPISKCMCKDC